MDILFIISKDTFNSSFQEIFLEGRQESGSVLHSVLPWARRLASLQGTSSGKEVLCSLPLSGRVKSDIVKLKFAYWKK